ncbi:MAG: AraC family transcriptional regulator [Polyangiales bacterium]
MEMQVAMCHVPPHSTISTAVVRALVDAVEEHGVARAAFLEAAGIDASQVESIDARISGVEAYALCELAVEQTGDPAFALRWADVLYGRALGPLTQLVTHAPTLRDGLASYARFSSLISDYTMLELVEDNDTATLRCRWLPSAPRMRRFVAEIIMAFFVRVARDFDRRVRPAQVCFAYEAPAYRDAYARVFEGAERFAQPFTGIVFPRALIDHRASQQDPDVHDALRALAERRLHRLQRQTSYALRVRDVLMRGESPHRADMATVAHALGMSVRSLHRRLTAEGASYQRLADETLAVLAKQYLHDPRRSIQEAAFDMGFSDVRSFHRAFKRWTGMTPGAYRLGGEGEVGT